MIRTLCVAAAIALGVSAAAAQGCQDPINTRQSLMKRSGEMGKVGAAMVKGATPFDLAKAQEILAAFAEDASMMPSLFPECSRTGDHNNASATIWESPGDFKAAIAKFAVDVKAAQDNTKDLESFKAGFQAVGKDCGGCHEKFRLKKS